MHIPRLVPASSRVAIIGAGASGLCTARAFISEGYKVQVYESRDDVGGTWLYSPKPYTSPMYATLRCNIPSQSMAYSDMAFPKGAPSFPPHATVQAYLRAYTERHNLWRHIRFQTEVLSVFRKGKRWGVSTKDGIQIFDAVIVCSGHYSVPHSWEVPGMKKFEDTGGIISHSVIYRVPDSFSGKKILVIGAGPSSLDISREVSETADSVVVSHRKGKGLFKGGIKDVGEIARLEEGGAIPYEGEKVLADKIIACTGYDYNFPFLEDGLANVKVIENGSAVSGLYGQIFAKEDATLAFIGIPRLIVPFPLFEDQAEFLVALYGGRVTKEHLLGVGEAGGPGASRKNHVMGPKQWEYRRRLADAAGRMTILDSVKEMHMDCGAARRRDFDTFREREYVKVDHGSGEWRVFVDGVDVTGMHEIP